MAKAQDRQEKLVKLQDLADLETGQLYIERFEEENLLYEKARKMRVLNKRIRKCALCPNMNIPQFTGNCPGWGNLNARIFFIGQSLHKPGMLSELPFILNSGTSIDAALHISNLRRRDVFFSNVIHCHPPNNRESTQEEKHNCKPFLTEELEIVKPSLVVTLGIDAKIAFNEILPVLSFKPKTLKIKHPASFMYSAPEQRINWIVKLSLSMDRIYKKDK